MDLKNSHHFKNLDANDVLLASENAGFTPTGEISQLNSYENRVFQVQLENSEPVIVKFYRPERWSAETIQEEHDFLFELAAEDFPVHVPLKDKNGKTLLKQKEFFVTFFPKIKGRLPQEILLKDYAEIGRRLAQLHNVGARKWAEHRPVLDTSHPGGWASLDLLQNWISPEIRNRYNKAAESLLQHIDELPLDQDLIRIHGDAHRGNLLHNGKQFFFIDFDDFCNGPAIQDVWMLLSGDKESFENEKENFLQGYEELRDFPHHQWEWIPLFRGFRILSYAGWIARRWSDPSFPKLFPEFGTYSYWAEETEALEKIVWSY